MQQDPTFKFATNFTCSFRHLVIKNSVLAGSPMHFSNADTASFLLLFSFINRLTICRYQKQLFWPRHLVSRHIYGVKELCTDSVSGLYG